MKTFTQLTLAILTVIITCSANANEPHCFDSTKVMRVVDGDTIDLRVHLLPFSLLTDIRVRMAGINAWESRTTNAAEKIKGLAAKERLKELSVGDITLCLTKKDKYGRWLGELFKGDVNINQQLIIEGHAHSYDGGKRKKFTPLM